MPTGTEPGLAAEMQLEPGTSEAKEKRRMGFVEADLCVERASIIATVFQVVTKAFCNVSGSLNM
ncbi:MAG: hypothetical protein QF437_25145 [Planctomycetota bacterium]|jgi:hypothetical protein|nr:hypothetical protein [Planctomycetota bacterium]MDP7397774.1 hypothetical protein [Lentisphaeria bacterium]